MPRWIELRAERLKPDLQKQYGKKKGEQVAFALATQMSHRLGKSPKTFKSKVTGKKESFGTPEARREAKLKYDQPRKEYRKTAAAEDRNVVMLSPDAAERMSNRIRRVAEPIVAGSSTIAGTGAGMVGGELVHRVANRLRQGTSMKFPAGPAGRTIGGVLGASVGLAHGLRKVREMSKRKPGVYERRMAQKAIRAAEKQGYTPVVQDSWLKIDRPKVREILRQDRRLGRETGAVSPKPGKMFKKKESMMVPPIVRDLVLDILEKEAALNLKAVGQGLKKGVKKVIGTAPGGANPLNPGSGLKGMVGRIAQPM